MNTGHVTNVNWWRQSGLYWSGRRAQWFISIIDTAVILKNCCLIDDAWKGKVSENITTDESLENKNSPICRHLTDTSANRFYSIDLLWNTAKNLFRKQSENFLEGNYKNQYKYKLNINIKINLKKRWNWILKRWLVQLENWSYIIPCACDSVHFSLCGDYAHEQNTPNIVQLWGTWSTFGTNTNPPRQYLLLLPLVNERDFCWLIILLQELSRQMLILCSFS